VEEGIVPGGGVALLNASKTLGALAAGAANQDVRVGVEIIQRAIRRPLQAISFNAGVAGDVIVGKLLEGSDPRWGYDASQGVYCDMIKAGIIDPTKVVRTALQDASSVAALMTTTEAAVAELPVDSTPAAGGGRGGMGGGMGDMGGEDLTAALCGAAAPPSLVPLLESHTFSSPLPSPLSPLLYPSFRNVSLVGLMVLMLRSFVSPVSSELIGESI
jgi:hypothetical protein